MFHLRYALQSCFTLEFGFNTLEKDKVGFNMKKDSCNKYVYWEIKTQWILKKIIIIINSDGIHLIVWLIIYFIVTISH